MLLQLVFPFASLSALQRHQNGTLLQNASTHLLLAGGYQPHTPSKFRQLHMQLREWCSWGGLQQQLQSRNQWASDFLFRTHAHFWRRIVAHLPVIKLKQPIPHTFSMLFRPANRSLRRMSNRRCCSCMACFWHCATFLDVGSVMWMSFCIFPGFTMQTYCDHKRSVNDFMEIVEVPQLQNPHIISSNAETRTSLLRRDNVASCSVCCASATTCLICSSAGWGVLGKLWMPWSMLSEHTCILQATMPSYAITWFVLLVSSLAEMLMDSRQEGQKTLFYRICWQQRLLCPVDQWQILGSTKLPPPIWGPNDDNPSYINTHF